MDNYQLNIDLLRLQGAFVTNIKDREQTKRCVCIPIDDAGLYVGQKGCYLDLAAFQLQNSQYGDTHCVKQSLSKQKRDAMTEEERKALPIIGNMRPIQSRTQNSVGNTVGVADSTIPQQDFSAEGDDDYPF